MRILILTLVLITLSGCGTTSSVKLAAQPPATTSFVFKDQRPEGQRSSSTDKSYTYFGDDKLEPSASDLLKTWLHRESDSQLNGKQVSLEEFLVYVHEPAVSVDMDAVNQAASSTPGGAGAAPLAGLFIYGIEKIKNGKSVTVMIRGKINQEEFSAIAHDSFRGRVTEENIRGVLVKALDQSVMEVRRVIGIN